MNYNAIDFSKPILIEVGVKSFLNQTLKQCHIIKTSYYNTMYNLFLLIIFIILLSLILYFKYKGKPTEEDIKNRNREKEQYVVSVIQKFEKAKTDENQKIIQEEMITGLPHFTFH
jgi:hypothetical protein